MNFVETLIEFASRFWPFALVEQWERGVFYFLGRAQVWDLQPGLYVYVPWFMNVRAVSVMPRPLSTPLLNITLRDGKTLSYSATAVARVVNPWLALNEIDDYGESTGELIASRLSEKLADVDAARLEPEKRGRLTSDLLKWLNEEARPFGVEVMALRFTNFALNQRAYRLLTDSALSSVEWGN